MSYPAFVWRNPATIGWRIADKNGDPVLGAAVTATLYRDRSLDTPDQTAGSAVALMTNLTLDEVGGGLYSKDIPAANVPNIGTNYVLVIEAKIDGVLIRHWEEDTEVSATTGKNLLCSLEAVKDHLDIEPTDQTEDGNLTRAIVACSKTFLNEIHRPNFFPARDCTEAIEIKNWQSESRFEDIYLSNYPVNSVASVTINEIDLPEYDPADPSVLGWIFDDKQPDESRQTITLCGMYWPVFETWMSPRRSIYRPSPLRALVSYNGGYTEVPADVEQAIIEWVAYKKGLRELQSMDQTTQWLQLGAFQQNTSIAQSTLKASAIEMPESVAKVISIYQRPIV